MVVSKDPIGCSDTKISEGIATVRESGSDDDSEETLSENLRIAGGDLPVEDITPPDPLIAANPPAFGFSVGADMRGLHLLACYHSQFGKVGLMRLGERRIEIRFAEPFRKGRTRLNCTLPGPDGRWRWFGRQFSVQPR